MGACSFTAEANRYGLDVVACDIVYDYTADDLERKGLQEVAHAIEQMEPAAKEYD